MSVRSMTGFSQVRRAIPQGEIVMSLKSVNHRGLDLHFHLPPELDSLEADIRGVLKSGVARGHLQVHLSFNRTVAGGAGAVNRPLLEAYMRAFEEASRLYRLDSRPDLNAALRIPGMLADVSDGELEEDVAKAMLEVTAEAVVTSRPRCSPGSLLERSRADFARSSALLGSLFAAFPRVLRPASPPAYPLRLTAEARAR